MAENLTESLYSCIVLCIKFHLQNLSLVAVLFNPCSLLKNGNSKITTPTCLMSLVKFINYSINECPLMIASLFHSYNLSGVVNSYIPFTINATHA